MNRIAPGTGTKLFNSGSIVDTLKSQGKDSSFSARKSLAGNAGIQNYTGSAEQNMQLLSFVQKNSTSSRSQTSASPSNTVSAESIASANTDTSEIDAAKLSISQGNAAITSDEVMSSALASKYLNPEDKVNETYIDKIGMETGMYADIQNIDTKILETYATISMNDNDIFGNPTLSNEEKIALSSQRKNSAYNQISQLRRLQNAKQKDLNDLALAEQKKAEAQAAQQKEALEFLKVQMDQEELNLKKAEFNIKLEQTEQDVNLKRRQFDLSVDKFELDRDKFTSETSQGATLPTGDFSALNVGEKYGNWNVTQTYGTGSVLQADNQPLVNGAYGTPGVDLSGNLGDPVQSFSGGTVVKVVTGKKNVSVADINAGRAQASYGNQVVVQDADGKLHYYNHLDSVQNIKEGQAIQKGQNIGTMGNTGSSTNVHLDYRVQSERGWEDPRAYMTNNSENPDEITGLDSYLSKRNSTGGGNVTSKVKPIYAANIIKEDIGRYELSTDEYEKLISIPGSNVDSRVTTQYTLGKIADVTLAPYSSEDLVDALRTMFDKNEGKEEQLLQAAIYSGKLDTGIWENGLFNDGAGYDMLQEYFDDPDETMSQIRKNLGQYGYGQKNNSSQTSQNSSGFSIGSVVSYGSSLVQ